MKADRILAALPLTEAHRARLRAAAPWAQFRFAETRRRTMCAGPTSSSATYRLR